MESFQLEAKNLSAVGGQAEMSAQQTPSSHGGSMPGLERQLQSPGDIAGARHFFAPKVEIQTVSSQAVPGLEHSASAALKAAGETISPLLQLIMRLPSHVSIFGSFLEVLKNFFLPHTDLLSHFSQVGAIQITDFAHAHSPGLSNLSQPLSSLLNHHPVDLSILPAHAHISDSMISQYGNIASAVRLHLSPSAALKHAMNVSAGIDFQHPQFEKLAASSGTSRNLVMNNTPNSVASGEALAGPGISTQSITPQVAPAQRIFTSKFFESVSGSHANAVTPAPNIALSSSQSSASSVTGGAAPSLSSSFNQQSTSHTATQASLESGSHIKGLHAQALSLNGVLHNGHHLHHADSSVAHKLNSHSSHSAIDDTMTSQHITHSTSRIVHSDQSHSHGSSGASLASAPESHLPSQSSSASAPANGLYRVKPGDSLWRIARHRLGDGVRWREIYNLNLNKLGSNPDLIHRGTAIDLPQPDQNILPAASQNTSMIASQPAAGNYTVKAGDNLWRISQSLLGDGQKWTELYKINGEVIGANPRMIFPGQKFDVPGLQSNSMLAQNTAATNPQLASAAAPVNHIAANPQAVNAVPADHIAANPHLASAHAGPLHNNVMHKIPQHPPTSVAVASNFRLIPENTILAHNHSPALMQPHINTNDGLAIENAHDQLLSGAGAAQAMVVKQKSVVSFSLSPDLSFLQAKK